MAASDTATPVLIVSTGRTGTRFLAEVLATCPTHVEAHHITPRSTLFNVLSNMHLSGVLPEGVLRGLWLRLKSEFAHTSRRLFVDANNHLFALAPMLKEFYPDLRVVHVVRDPRTYVRSHLNWAAQRLRSRVANHVIPFWQPNGWLLGEVSALEWLRMSKFEQFCWIWSFKNRLMATMAETGIPYLCLRFEDLVESSEAEQSMSRLCAFIGLEHTSAMTSHQPVNQTTTRSYPGWHQWTKQRCQSLHLQCGELMQSYGYGTEPDWQAKLELNP